MFVGKVKKKEDLEIMSLRSITGDSPYIYTMKVVCKSVPAYCTRTTHNEN